MKKRGNEPPALAERRKRRTMNQSDTLKMWSDSGILIPTRTLYLGSISADSNDSETGVDYAMARQFEIGMRTLEYLGPRDPITVIMNNPGGDYYHGMAIHDRIIDSPCDVTIKVYGYLMSMGPYILQAAKRRLLSRRATVMLHYGVASHEGNMIDHERSGEETKRLRGVMEDVLLDPMKRKDNDFTIEKLREMLRNDHFMDAARAIKMGLADGYTSTLPRTPKKPKLVPETNTASS